MNCPACNAEIADSAKFCPECGEKIVRKTLCPGCGAEVTPGAKFCPECGEKIVRKNEDDGANFIECPTNSDLVANAGTPTAIKIPRNVPSGYEYRDGGYFFTIRTQLKNESAHDAASLDIDLVFFKEDASGNIEERYSVAHTLVPGRQLCAGETRKFEFKDLILDENPPTGTYQVAIVVSEVKEITGDGQGYKHNFVDSAEFPDSQDWTHYNDDAETVIETDGYMARSDYSSDIEIDGCAMSVSRQSNTINVVIRSLVNKSHWNAGSLRACLWAFFEPPKETDDDSDVLVWERDLIRDSLEPGQGLADLSVSGEVGELLQTMDFYPVLSIVEFNADGNWYSVARKALPKVEALWSRRRSL